MSFIGHLEEMMSKFVANLINGKVKKWKGLMSPLIILELLDWVSVRLDRVRLIIF